MAPNRLPDFLIIGAAKAKWVKELKKKLACMLLEPVILLANIRLFMAP